MNYAKTILLAASAASPLLAQNITMTMVAATPVVVSASANLQSNTNTLPAGPLGSQAAVFVQANGGSLMEFAGAGLSLSANQPTTEEAVAFYYQAQGGTGAATGAASAGIALHDILLLLTAPSPRAVTVDFDLSLIVSPGQPAPRLEVDIENDGSIEFSTLVSAGLVSLVVGPVPTPIRIRGEFQAASPIGQTGQFLASMRLAVRADNRLNILTQEVGCLMGSISCHAAFAHDGIKVREFPGPGLATLAVIGLAQQPLLLPGVQFCLLLPRPDLVVVLGQSGLDLSIPAAARPLILHVQGVALLPSTLLTTRAFRIQAN